MDRVDRYLVQYVEAVSEENGAMLAEMLALIPTRKQDIGTGVESIMQYLGYPLPRTSTPSYRKPTPEMLDKQSHVDWIVSDAAFQRENYIKKRLANMESGWIDIITSYIKVITSVHAASKCRGLEEQEGWMTTAVNEQSHMAQSFHALFVHLNKWALPVLYVLNSHLKKLCIKADVILDKLGKKTGKLEEAVRVMYKAFTCCITDRFSPMPISRKWGTYAIVNLLFASYFRLKSLNLCGNITRALTASDLPELQHYPLAHRVQYAYYQGALAFREENYRKAQEEMMFCFTHCPSSCRRIKSLACNYLIPLEMLRGILPTPRLFQLYPDLRIYRPFAEAIRSGDLASFDVALMSEQVERELVERGVFLLIERLRFLCVRVLFKKVWLLNEKEAKLPLAQFHVALFMSCQRLNQMHEKYDEKPIEGMYFSTAIGGMSLDSDSSLAEVECLLANMIDQGYLKGYLSHEKQFAVLSQKDPFPALNHKPI